MIEESCPLERPMPPSIRRRTRDRTPARGHCICPRPPRAPPKDIPGTVLVDVDENTKTPTPLGCTITPCHAGPQKEKKETELILGLNGRSPRLNRTPKVSLDRRVLVLSWQQPVVPVLARRGQECGRLRSLDLRGPDVGGKSRPDLPGVQDGANSRGYVVFVFWLVGCGDPCSRGTTGRGGSANATDFGCVGQRAKLFFLSRCSLAHDGHSVSRPPARAHP